MEMPLLWIELWKLLVMEVATQHQLSQMQETSKASIHYLNYGQNSKSHQHYKAKRTTQPESSGTPGNFQLTLQGSGKDRKTKLPFVFALAKANTKRTNNVQLQIPYVDSRMWKGRTLGKHMSI